MLTGIKADGKPDLMERKTCNMIEAMEVRNLNMIVVVSLTIILGRVSSRQLRWEFIRENKKVRKKENTKARTRPRK